MYSSIAMRFLEEDIEFGNAKDLLVDYCAARYGVHRSEGITSWRVPPLCLMLSRDGCDYGANWPDPGETCLGDAPGDVCTCRIATWIQCRFGQIAVMLAHEH